MGKGGGQEVRIIWNMVGTGGGRNMKKEVRKRIGIGLEQEVDKDEAGGEANGLK